MDLWIIIINHLPRSLLPLSYKINIMPMLPMIGQAQLIIVLCNPSSLNKEACILPKKANLNSQGMLLSVSLVSEI
jgi:hypothetical protein